MRWVRDPPCLVLQWVDNEVVSMTTTVGNANEQGQVTGRVRADGEWGETLVKQPQIFKTYKMKMVLTGQTRSSLHLAPGGNVCDGGKLCFSVSLILLWLTVSFCFRHIGLSIQRSKDRLGIRNVIFAIKLFGKSVALRSSVIPLLIIQGGRGLNPAEFETVHVPRFSEQKKN